MFQPVELRVDLGDHDDSTRYAEYSSFNILDEDNNYKLEVSGYSGDAGGCQFRLNHIAMSYLISRDCK